MSVQQLRWLARAWGYGPGGTALREVYSSYVVLLVGVLIVFGGNGLQPETVVRFVWTTPMGGMLLLLSWGAWTSRAYRAVVLDPSWALLRTFPLRGWTLISSGLVFIVVVESPWLALWLIGSGPLAALVALGGSLLTSWLWIDVVSRARNPLAARVRIRLPLLAQCTGLRSNVVASLHSRPRYWNRLVVGCDSLGHSHVTTRSRKPRQ